MSLVGIETLLERVKPEHPVPPQWLVDLVDAENKEATNDRKYF